MEQNKIIRIFLLILSSGLVFYQWPYLKYSNWFWFIVSILIEHLFQNNASAHSLGIQHIYGNLVPLSLSGGGFELFNYNSSLRYGGCSSSYAENFSLKAYLEQERAITKILF